MSGNGEGYKWPAVPIPTPDEVYAGMSEEAMEYPLWLESQFRMETHGRKPENLDGIRVLDLTTNMMIGHWASSMLSEEGAEVIQVEPPGGDPARQFVPFGRKEYMFRDKERGEPISPFYLHEMRNKKSITLNLETEEGREILKAMAKHVDVIIENFPPGWTDEHGIGYRQMRELNKRLVYCWVGQRGQWGPSKDRPGELDPAAQAACGFVHGTGVPKEMGGRPTRSALWVCDYVGGTNAAAGIILALLYRDTVSGEGQWVEATGAEGIIRIIDYNWGWYGMDGSIRPRYGNWDLAINIYAVNPCKDGFFMVGGGHDRLWYRIWRAVGLDNPELEDDIVGDPKLREVTERLPHPMQVKTYTNLANWQKDQSRADAEVKMLAQQVASGGVTYVDEVAEYPHFKYREQVVELDDPLYGKVLYATPPQMQSVCPPRVKWLGRPVGYDNDEVYRYLLGASREQLTAWKEAGVI